MDKGKKLILIFIILAGIITSCSKKLVPGFEPAKSGKSYDKASYEYLFVEATRLKLEGNLGEALKLFEQCIGMNPQSDASYYQMAQIVLSNRDVDDGKKYLEKAANIDPGNIWYELMLADIYYQQQNVDSAIYCYERAVKFYPEREDLQISLANLYTEDKKYEKARSILNKFDEKYGINENTTISLVRNLIADKKYREALGKVKELLEQKPEDVQYNGMLAEIYRMDGNNEKAAEIYNGLIERNPDNPEIQLSLCDFLVSQKNYEELFILLNTVVLNGKITREDKIKLFAGLIDNPDIQKNYGKNMEVALMLLEANYTNDDIIILILPDFLQKENKLADAAQKLEEIISDKPDNYFAWEKLLMVYYDMKDFKKLQERAEQCATMFNRSILAKLLYANAAIENKDYNIALDELRKAEILAGDDKDQMLQVLSMKAELYYRMKEYDNAYKTFDDALKINDSDPTILNNYAYYLAEQDQRLKDAEKMAKSVIDKERNNTTYLDTYAWVLFKRGKTRDAARIMERIINSGEKEDSEWYEHYGFILKKMRRCDEAVKMWEKAINADKTKTYLENEIRSCKN